MRISTFKPALISILGTLTIGTWLAPASAATGFNPEGMRRANGYQTYAPGSAGCVDDLGYGRVRTECHGD